MSTLALSTTQSEKSSDKSLKPAAAPKGSAGVFVDASGCSLLRSASAALVPLGSTGATLDAKQKRVNPPQIRVESHKRVHPKFTPKHRLFLKGLVRGVNELLAERSSLLRASDEFDKKYVSIDNKGFSTNPFTDKLLLNDSRLGEMKSIARSTFGDMEIPVRLVVIYVPGNTGAGVNQTVNTLDPAYSIEFAGLAALFEQVRTRAVHLEYRPSSYTLIPGVTAAPQGVGGITIDTVGVTAAASLSDVVDSSNHMLYDIAIINAATIATAACTIKNCGHASMTYRPPDLWMPNGSVTGVAGGSWTATVGTAGSVDIAGFMKWYETNAAANTVQVGTLAARFDCQFRCRD